MRAVSVIAIIVALVTLTAGVGAAYAFYNSNLIDNETATINNNYGTASLSENDGVYTLSYQDTTADSVYLTLTVSGLEHPQGTIIDLWLGEENAMSEFSTKYSFAVDGNTLTSLSRPLAHNGSNYSDGDSTYTVTCSAGDITVMKGVQELSVLMGMFYDDGRCYTVDATGNTVSSVSLMIPIDGSDGKYAFDDGGYRYMITCSGSSVTAAKKCVVVSSSVNNLGVVKFSTWAIDLTAKAWIDTIALYSDSTAVDLSSCDIDAVFYSTGGLE